MNTIVSKIVRHTLIELYGEIQMYVGGAWEREIILYQVSGIDAKRRQVLGSRHICFFVMHMVYIHLPLRSIFSGEKKIARAASWRHLMGLAGQQVFFEGCPSKEPSFYWLPGAKYFGNSCLNIRIFNSSKQKCHLKVTKWMSVACLFH